MFKGNWGLSVFLTDNDVKNKQEQEGSAALANSSERGFKVSRLALLLVVIPVLSLSACGGGTEDDSPLFGAPSTEGDNGGSLGGGPTSRATPRPPRDIPLTMPQAERTDTPVTAPSPYVPPTPEPTPDASAEPTASPIPSTSPTPVVTPTPSATPEPGTPRTTAMRNYIFGHSLIVHTPPMIATPSDETTVPHWMRLLSEAAGFDYLVSGQYGFLRDHSRLPPRPIWGFDIIPTIWDDDASSETFANRDFDTVLITASNFIQYKPSNQIYDFDNAEGTTPLAETLEIIDWVNTEEPGAVVYIYENWPDMGPFADPFPANSTQFANYNAHTISTFHQWWIDYHDYIMAARPTANIRMIPIGPTISKVLTNTNLSGIPITELYEDNAPHGRPTIYFLAGLVNYMGTYGVKPPSDYIVPDIVHSLARDNYNDVVDYIWNELENFEDDSGNSRVW